MNDVYKNPEYIKEIDDNMDDMSILLQMQPRVAYKIIVDKIDQITKSEKFQNAISCGSITNCSFCCHDTIFMGEVEANYIKEIVVSKKIVFSKERAKKQNSGDKLSWMDKACPMLQDENSEGNRLCGIYKNRPLICRTHNNSINPLDCNKENDPTKTIREAKAAILDAFSLTAVMLGQEKPSRAKPPKLVDMNEILREIE